MWFTNHRPFNIWILKLTKQKSNIRHKGFRSFVRFFFVCDAQGTPLDFETGLTGDFWSQTNPTNCQNLENTFFLFLKKNHIVWGRKKKNSDFFQIIQTCRFLLNGFLEHLFLHFTCWLLWKYWRKLCHFFHERINDIFVWQNRSWM